MRVPETWRKDPTATHSRYFHLETGVEIRQISTREWWVRIPNLPRQSVRAVERRRGTLTAALAAADWWIVQARQVIAECWDDAHNPTFLAGQRFIQRVRQVREDSVDATGHATIGLRDAWATALAEVHEDALNVFVDEVQQSRIAGEARRGKSNTAAVLADLTRAGRKDDAVIGPIAAKQYASSGKLQAALATRAAMTGTVLVDLDDERRRVYETHGITAQGFDRLHPGVDPTMADELRPYFAHVAAELVRAVADLTDLDPTVYDPCAPGYRIAVHAARTSGTLRSESVRLALLHLELGLTSGAHAHLGIARAGAIKAAQKLGIAPYQPAAS